MASGSVEILRALRRTRELLATSRDCDWSPSSVRLLEQRLEAVIRSIEAGRRPALRLGMLFRGTGSLQDISLASGWGDEFLALAAAVDAYLRRDTS